MAEENITEEDVYDVGMEGSEDSREPLVYDEDAPNLVDVFEGHEEGRMALKKVLEQVTTDYDSAYSSMEEYRERVAADYQSYCADLPPKQYPWKNAANPNLPMSLENIARAYARIAGELFGNWRDTFSHVGIGPEDEDAARIMSKYDNHQLSHLVKGFRNQMERGLLQFLLQNEAFCQSHFDPVNEQNCHEILTSDEFFIPYVSITVAPDMSDVPFKVRVCRYYKQDLEKMRHHWAHVQEVLDRKAPSYEEEPDEPITEAASETENIHIPDSDDSAAPYKLYWYEGYMKLPSQAESRYCKCVVDPFTRNILLLQILEEADWADVQRYQQELQLQQDFIQAHQNYQQHVLPAMEMDSALRTRLGMPDVDPLEAQTLVQGMDADQAASPLPMGPPQPTGWLAGVADPFNALPEPPKKKPIHMWSHMSCIIPLKSAFGVSLGRIQANLTRAANCALAQFTDAATLANSWSLVVPSQLRFKQPFKIQPGGVNTVHGMSGPEIRKSLVELKPDPANSQLIEVVRMMLEAGQSSMQSPDVLSGEAGKSGETFRGHASRIEQAYKQLGFYARRYGMFYQEILERNADLNARYLPDDAVQRVFDHLANTMVPMRIGRGYWQMRERMTVLRADMRFTTDSQRVQEADELAGLAQGVPALQFNQAYQYEVARRMLHARGADDLIETLGARPPPPEQFGMPPPAPPMAPPGADPAAAGPPAPPG